MTTLRETFTVTERKKKKRSVNLGNYCDLGNDRCYFFTSFVSCECVLWNNWNKSCR